MGPILDNVLDLACVSLGNHFHQPPWGSETKSFLWAPKYIMGPSHLTYSA